MSDLARRYLRLHLIAGVVTTVYWTPLAAGGWAPPAANAFYDDLQPSDHMDVTTRPRPEPEALPTEPEALPTEPKASPPEPNASPTAAPDLLAVARDREPISLSIPDLGVESPVVTTSMDASRGVVVPEDVLETGWYDGSRRLGASYGSTVIVGHRDSATQGERGALRHRRTPARIDHHRHCSRRNDARVHRRLGRVDRQVPTARRSATNFRTYG